MSSTVVQTLWIGPRLSIMEQLSIASFLHHGHDVHLYVYERPEGIPKGTTVRDATEILPASRIFRYATRDTYAGFANFFRYKLLLERGGWWVDADVVCVGSFDMDAPYVFSSEEVNGSITPNVGALKAPPGSAVMEYAWEYCDRSDVRTLRWGHTGPLLIRSAIAMHGLEEWVQPPEVFCPIGYPYWSSLIDPDEECPLPEQTRGIHLWNEMWRRSGVSKDASYEPSCLYERLKRRYLA